MLPWHWKNLSMACTMMAIEIFSKSGRALARLSSGSSGTLQSCEKMASFPGVLLGLVKVVAKDSGARPQTKKFGARALANLASQSDELRWKIIKTPRILEELSNGFHCDANRYFQEACAVAFATFTCHLKSCEEIGSSPRALAGLVKVDKDSGCRRDAKTFGAKALADLASKGRHDLGQKVIDTPRALEELSNGLYSNGNRYFQEECARAFASLTCDLKSCEKIGSSPRALAGLVKVLAKDSCRDAKKFGARALANLASKDSHDLGQKVIDTPRALEELSNGLKCDRNSYFKRECARAFAELKKNFSGALTGLAGVHAEGSGCHPKA